MAEKGSEVLRREEDRELADAPPTTSTTTTATETESTTPTPTRPTEEVESSGGFPIQAAGTGTPEVCDPCYAREPAAVPPPPPKPPSLPGGVASGTETPVSADDAPDGRRVERPPAPYLSEDVLLRHVDRQAGIVKQSLADRLTLQASVGELSRAYEKELFCPRVPPKKQENGTCQPDPRINFFPTFAVAETLASYHIFFHNQKIPLSCRANRTQTDSILRLESGDALPCFPTLQLVTRIFEGLGTDEKVASHALKEAEDNSALVELEGDSPRLTVVKRTLSLTHFAYPAVTLPPKVMSAVTEELLQKQQKPLDGSEPSDAFEPSVTDAQLARWLGLDSIIGEKNAVLLEERRKLMMAVCLVTVQLECMHRFFTAPDVIKKLGESLHYAFRHGYVKQACLISNVELTNVISYLGILHENRLGQSTLHTTLKDESRRDYIRDTVYLYLLYTWQTAMGVWQQCLETENLRELRKILERSRRALWTGFDELTIAQDLAEIIFPPKLLSTLQGGLPDLFSQSMMQNFRSFVLERSGILPAMCCALPSDFVPISYRECPPTLWAYTYLLKLANYLMYHTDIAYDRTGVGLLECYCRCNLCTPHRCLATNPALLSESQLIGTFEIQGPPGEDGQPTKAPLKLTAGLWTSAFLRKFVSEDYNAHKIAFYEDQSKRSKVQPGACVITQEAVLAQLHEIKKARQDFLLKKGHGVYLDPHTGEELNGPAPTLVRNESQGRRTESGRFDRHGSKEAPPSPADPGREPLRGGRGHGSQRGRGGSQRHQRTQRRRRCGTFNGEGPGPGRSPDRRNADPQPPTQGE